MKKILFLFAFVITLISCNSRTESNADMLKRMADENESLVKQTKLTRERQEAENQIMESQIEESKSLDNLRLTLVASGNVKEAKKVKAQSDSLRALMKKESEPHGFDLQKTEAKAR